jgi:hypothetical protein
MTGAHRKRKRVTTTGDYAAMLHRMLAAYGRRVAEDPAAVEHLAGIERSLTAAVNLGLYQAAAAGRSAQDLADVLGVSRQAVYKRLALGEAEARAAEAAQRAQIRAQIGGATTAAAPRRALPPGVS